MSKKPLLLMILDGWGIGDGGVHDAVHTAATPNLDALFARYPHAKLQTSGMAVGLPDGQMGNSEVGHTNLGAGRVVYQELTRITKEIRDGAFFENTALLQAVEYAKANGGVVHLMGLLSDGGVHSHITHLYALLQLCRDKGVAARVHCFLDGRDTPPQSGLGYVQALEEKMAELGGDLAIATVQGRFYAMDRDKRWDRLEKAYRALTAGEGAAAESGSAAVQASYDAGLTDEFMLPAVCPKAKNIQRTDSVIFYNFRPDRAREITHALADDDFDGFARENGAVKPHYVCFTQYEAGMPNVSVAFLPQVLTNILGEYIAEKGLTQLRIAETEKYAHVTFFFNGGEERSFDGEDRVLVASPKVATYDLQPEMSAEEVTDRCVERIRSGAYDVIILNYANCDMVGHTGVFDAAVKAVETVDTCVGRVMAAVEEMGGTAIITADHGNADKMAEDGQPFTAHTTNPVPVILCKDGAAIHDGALCDIAPTMLQLLNLPQPAEMTGRSLLD